MYLNLKFECGKKDEKAINNNSFYLFCSRTKKGGVLKIFASCDTVDEQYVDSSIAICVLRFGSDYPSLY